MYNLTEQTIHKVLQTGKKILSDLKASPIWGMIEKEPTVSDFSDAIDELEKQVNQNEAQS